MLQIPDLDDITYEQILQGAVHKIPLLTNEWTDFNRHDPGITTLETYAWLTDMLNYYINATGNVHILKYMKLLGITELPKQAAKAWVCVETDGENVVLPKGFPIYAGEKCFVCEETVEITDNCFKALLYESRGVLSDLTAFAGEDGSYAKVFRAGTKEEESIYLGFEKALQEDTQLYITLKEYQERESLPKGFRLSTIQCSCFDGKSWIPLEIVEDNTNGLLQSGVLSLHVPFIMDKCRLKDGMEGYFLKMTVTDNQYDVTPKIGKIFLNPVKMIQKSEQSVRITYQYSDEKKTYQIPHYISQQDKITVGVCVDKEKEIYRLAYEFEPKSTDEACVDYETGAISFRKEAEPKDGCEIDVFLVKEEFIGEMQIGITDGCAGQKIPFFVQEPYEMQLVLFYSQNEKTYYENWRYIDSLEQASFEDQVFTYDKETNTIQFGDGMHGMVPESGCVVAVSECTLSDYEDGNVRAGEIRRIKDDKYRKLRAHNTAMAVGGRNGDSIERMQKRLEEKVLMQNRVVSPMDFEKVVKQIPGLMIRGAKVVAAKEYCQNHAISYKPYDTYVVVCPESMKPREKLSDRYHDYICDYLEKYRMLNTRVKVVEPAYGCINFSGRIRIRGNNTAAKAEIEQFLHNYVEEMQQQCCFGAVLSYGDIFMQLENLEYVEMVEELHLSLAGEMGRKNDKGDILLNSDCLPYTGDLDFEYRE